MTYTFTRLRVGDARAIAAWRYEGPYAVYDLDGPTLLLQALFPALFGGRFYAAHAGGEDLVGLFTYTQRGRTLTIGLALRPDLTGRGRGLDFVRAGLAFGTRHFAPWRFRLEVAAFNRRAIAVYARAGFIPAKTSRKLTAHGVVEHLEMVRDV